MAVNDKSMPLKKGMLFKTSMQPAAPTYMKVRQMRELTGVKKGIYEKGQK